MIANVQRDDAGRWWLNLDAGNKKAAINLGRLHTEDVREMLEQARDIPLAGPEQQLGLGI